MKLMAGQNVQQTWVASLETDSYLLPTGEVMKADFASTSWTDDLVSTKACIITDPFLNPATGKQVISIVTPVLSEDGSMVLSGLWAYCVRHAGVSLTPACFRIAGKDGLAGHEDHAPAVPVLREMLARETAGGRG